MLYILLVIALGLAGYFGLMYYFLRKSLGEVNDELREVTGSLVENRIVKLPNPDKDLEALLETTNMILEKTREESVEYARREAALKSQIESIGHDLRTPLTSIQGYLSLIETSKLDSESIEALEVVNRKVDSLQRLIIQFYELSQLEYNSDSRNLYTYDVAFLLRETLAAHYRILSKRNLAMTLKIPETRIEALVNHDALERIFANLIENAGRYALTRMEIEVFASAKQVQMLFSNDCDLVEEINLEELFVPFYVGHSSRPQGSSGLGLAIARQLAEGMNANLEVTLDRNADGQTICFALSLPR